LNLLIAKWPRAQRKGIPRFGAQDLRLGNGREMGALPSVFEKRERKNRPRGLLKAVTRRRPRRRYLIP